MPYSSAEISAAIGAFQGQSMNNQAYSQMIGMGSQGQFAERVAGGGMSRLAGIGAPLISGAMGLAGLDPMSLGLRAGMSAFGGGSSLMGAGMAGLGVMGAASGGLAMAGYAGNQVMVGAQQQSHLNNSLRGSFNFLNPNGGQGFNRSDMGVIGNQMRGMSQQFGPEGQVTSMSELTNLAAGMGKMGMGQGVRDAQEFGKRFREMVTTLKTMAKELGTSLEEAQQFMQAQRSSGIFKTSDQARFSMQARGTSLAGGLALSEVTGMASIGSQISRSVGGLGGQGAFGGMRAIGQIGSAMQVGAISEESIYNATGLNGAEGRAAMAANMMSQSGSFLKSGRGRYFLASMAGRNGQLDEESVANWMSGGMDVGETKGQANRNLARVGRANFIRNEGHLRGAVLERFGGMAQTMAYQQWLGSRGYDPSNMDDKSMLAFQRFSGMGRDEADAAISMVQKLPEMMTHQRQSEQDDRFGQQQSHYMQTHGIQGLKRKIEHVRENIQGKLQRVGQDIFNSGSDMIEQWFKGVMDVYERRVSGDADQVWQSSKMGGRGAQQLSTLLHAGGGKNSSMFTAVAGDPSRQIYDRSKNLQFAAQMGASGPSTSTSLSSGLRDWVRDQYTSSLSTVTSEKRIEEFGKSLKQKASSGDAHAAALYETWKQTKNPADRAGLLGAIEKQADISEGVQLAKSWELPELEQAKGLFRTVRQGDVAVGKSIMGPLGKVGKDEGFFGSLGTNIATGLAGLAGSFMYNTKTGKNMAGELADKVAGVVSGNEEVAASIGSYARSKEGAGIMRGLATGDKNAKEAAQNEISEINIRDRQAGGELSARDKGVRALLQQTTLGMEAETATSESARAELLAKADKMLGREPGTTTRQELLRFRDQARGIVGSQAVDDIMHLTDRARDDLSAHGQAYAKMGLGKLNADGTVSLNVSTFKGLGEGGASVMGHAVQAMSLAAKLGTDPSQNADLLEQISNEEAAEYGDISKMSISEKKALARKAAGTQEGSMAGESILREKRLKGMMGRGKGVVGGIGGLMGLDISKEEMQGMQGKDAASIAEFLASKGDIKDKEFKGELEKAVDAAKSGKVGQAADILNRGISQSEEAKKKLGEGKRDPQEEMSTAIKQGNKYLEALVKSNTAAAAELASINAKTGTSEPEGDGHATSRKPG